MTTVVGLFRSSDQALDALEALRGATLQTETLRVVGQAESATDLAREGAGASVAAGPPQDVIDGLLESDLTPAELLEARQRVEGGGLLVMADELDDDTANTLAQHLRDLRAENVIVKGVPSPRVPGRG